MKTMPNRWIWRLCAVPSVSLLLYAGGVAHAGKPAPTRARPNGATRYFTPGPAPFAMPGQSPFVVPGPGQGGLVSPRLLYAPVSQADSANSVDRCLVPVRDVDPGFIVAPRVTDERMIVAPKVVGQPVGSSR